ncbi:MAG: DUF3187 family protein [Nitrospiraceae bacterium]|nr:MAG: DUF3187 family protein [Nitrospiraceae bacterium]
MRILYGVLVFVCLFFTGLPAHPFEGPLQVKNSFPIFLHADQPYLEKAAAENSVSLSLSHSSTYTVQSSADWEIGLDMEITELNLRYKRIIMDAVELGIDVPLLIIGGGFTDNFLENYHQAVGLKDPYGRGQRPHNEFLYIVRRDGRPVIEGKSGTKIGDIRLALKKPLISGDGFSLSVRGDVELPSGNAKEGYGNGSVDAAVSLLLDKKITDSIMTNWNIGAVFPGDVKGHEEVELENFVYGGAAVEALLGSGYSLLVQVLGQSPIYPDTDLMAIDREAWLLAFGGRYEKDNGSWELSLTEDINNSGAPDYILNLTYKLKL